MESAGVSRTQFRKKQQLFHQSTTIQGGMMTLTALPFEVRTTGFGPASEVLTVRPEGDVFFANGEHSFGFRGYGQWRRFDRPLPARDSLRTAWKFQPPRLGPEHRLTILAATLIGLGLVTPRGAGHHRFLGCVIGRRQLTALRTPDYLGLTETIKEMSVTLIRWFGVPEDSVTVTIEGTRLEV